MNEIFLGIDIGSASSKAVLIQSNGQILARAVEQMGVGTEGSQLVIRKVLEAANISKERICRTVATGYGRNRYPDADLQITEISCHGKGISYLEPGARTVIDIGGQDAKVIRLSECGIVENFVMNEKCAAGTGRFLEVMARILHCGIDQLSQLAAQAENSVTISNTCTVFAESEVISQLASGASKADAAKGILLSIARRIAGLANRIGVVSPVVMSGGVALNQAVVTMISAELRCPVHAVRDPQTAGALGAALYALENDK